MAEAVETPLRSSFQRQVITVRTRVILYLRLKASVLLPDSADTYAELLALQTELPLGTAAMQAQGRGEPHEAERIKTMRTLANRFAYMEQLGYLRAVPPEAGNGDPTQWATLGGVMQEALLTGKVHPRAVAYAAMGDAWRKGDAERFNGITRQFHDELEGRYASAMRKSDVEARFNAAGPFYSSMVLYVIAFLFGIGSWLTWADSSRRSAFFLLTLAFVVSTVGIFTRMWLEGRPPVTNLYSSALFVGWGAVLICLVLERLHRNGVGSVAGGMIGLTRLPW